MSVTHKIKSVCKFFSNRVVTNTQFPTYKENLKICKQSYNFYVYNSKGLYSSCCTRVLIFQEQTVLYR